MNLRPYKAVDKGGKVVSRLYEAIDKCVSRGSRLHRTADKGARVISRPHEPINKDTRKNLLSKFPHPTKK